MVKHVRSELRVLDEFLSTYEALVILASCVSSNVSVERLFSGEAVVTHWTAVRPFAGVYASMLCQST